MLLQLEKFIRLSPAQTPTKGLEWASCEQRLFCPPLLRHIGLWLLWLLHAWAILSFFRLAYTANSWPAYSSFLFSALAFHVPCWLLYLWQHSVRANGLPIDNCLNPDKMFSHSEYGVEIQLWAPFLGSEGTAISIRRRCGKRGSNLEMLVYPD